MFLAESKFSEKICQSSTALLHGICPLGFTKLTGTCEGQINQDKIFKATQTSQNPLDTCRLYHNFHQRQFQSKTLIRHKDLVLATQR